MATSVCSRNLCSSKFWRRARGRFASSPCNCLCPLRATALRRACNCVTCTCTPLFMTVRVPRATRGKQRQLQLPCAMPADRDATAAALCSMCCCARLELYSLAGAPCACPHSTGKPRRAVHQYCTRSYVVCSCSADGKRAVAQCAMRNAQCAGPPARPPARPPCLQLPRACPSLLDSRSCVWPWPWVLRTMHMAEAPVRLPHR